MCLDYIYTYAYSSKKMDLIHQHDPFWFGHNKLLYYVINGESEAAKAFKAKYRIDVNLSQFRTRPEYQPMPLLHAYLYGTPDEKLTVNGMFCLQQLGGIDANKVITINEKQYTPLLLAVERSRHLAFYSYLINSFHVDTRSPSVLIPCLQTLAKKASSGWLRNFLGDIDPSQIGQNEGSLLYCPFDNIITHTYAPLDFEIFDFVHTLQILMESCNQDPFFTPSDRKMPILHTAIEFGVTMHKYKQLSRFFFKEIIQCLLDGGANPLAYSRNGIIQPSALEFYRTLDDSLRTDIAPILIEGEKTFKAHPDNQKRLMLAMALHKKNETSPLYLLDGELSQMVRQHAFEDRYNIREALQKRFDAALWNFANIRPDQLSPYGQLQRDKYIEGINKYELTRQYIQTLI